MAVDAPTQKLRADDLRAAQAVYNAVAGGRAAELKELLAANAGYAWKDELGMTALHVACKENLFECAAALVGAGAPLDGADHGGQTPLHWASLYGHASLVEWLLGHSAPSDARDHAGSTASDNARIAGQDDVASTLDNLAGVQRLRDEVAKSLQQQVVEKKAAEEAATRALAELEARQADAATKLQAGARRRSATEEAATLREDFERSVADVYGRARDTLEASEEARRVRELETQLALR